MSDIDSYDDFLDEYHALSEGGYGAQLDLVSSIIDAATSWTGEMCTAWVVRLAENLYEIGEGVRWPRLDPSMLREGETTWFDIVDKLIELLQTLVSRIDALKMEVPKEDLDMCLHSLAIEGIIVDLPRRDLVDRCHRWAVADWEGPALAAYAHQANEKATPAEKIQIVKEMARNKENDEYSPAWIKLALPAAVSIAPELVRPWLDKLRGLWGPDPDPLDAALVTHYEHWLNRVSDTQSPLCLTSYAACPVVSADDARTTLEALDADEHESWRVSRVLIVAMIRRELSLLDPLLPQHVLSAAFGPALPMLTAYQQLSQTGNRDPVVACSLLTLAVERQLRCALVREAPAFAVAAIRNAGLAELAVFAEGRPTGNLPSGLGLKVSCQNEKLLNFLRRAGRIRNRVHHPREFLGVQDAEYLRRAIFDDDPGALRALSGITSLRCKAVS